MKRAELSFDGFGINGPGVYRERVATFSRFLKEKDAQKYGPLFAAAPELLECLKRNHAVWMGKNHKHEVCSTCLLISKAEKGA